MEKLSGLEVNEGLTGSWCCWDNCLSPRKHPMPPHLEPFPRLMGFKHHIWPFIKFPALHRFMVICGRGDGGMNQVKLSEQVAGRVTTVSLSRLVTRPPRGTLVRGLTQKSYGSDRLAVFPHSSTGGFLVVGRAGRIHL